MYFFVYYINYSVFYQYKISILKIFRGGGGDIPGTLEERIFRENFFSCRYSSKNIFSSGNFTQVYCYLVGPKTNLSFFIWFIYISCGFFFYKYSGSEKEIIRTDPLRVGFFETIIFFSCRHSTKNIFNLRNFTQVFFYFPTLRS